MPPVNRAEVVHRVEGLAVGGAGPTAVRDREDRAGSCGHDSGTEPEPASRPVHDAGGETPERHDDEYEPPGHGRRLHASRVTEPTSIFVSRPGDR